MRAAGNLRADNRRLRAKQLCKNLFERITPHVVIAVARRRREMPVRHLMLPEGVQHAARPNFLHAVNAGELRRQAAFRLCNQFFNGHFASPCV